MPSSASRGGRRRTEPSLLPPAVDVDARDWAELPPDAVGTFLGKLPLGDALMDASQACRSWRRAAAEEPALWRRVEARSRAQLAAARLAVRTSAGRCEAFAAEHVGDDRLLLYIAEQLPGLKSLCLISCYSISNEAFVEAMKMLPLLEKLEISLCKNIFGEAIQAAAKACPRLKRFRLSNDRFFCYVDDQYNHDQEAQGISAMRELRSLQLFANNLSNNGLLAILDGCPHLESLDIRHCFNVKMDAVLQAKCARIGVLRLPDDITDDYEFEVNSPIRLDPNINHEDDLLDGFEGLLWPIQNLPGDEEDEYYDDYQMEDDDIDEDDAFLHMDKEAMMLDYDVFW